VLGSSVPGGSRPATIAGDGSNVELRSELGNHRCDGLCAAVVDDNDLEPISRIALIRQRTQAVPQLGRTIVCRNDHRNVAVPLGHVASSRLRS